MGEMERPDLESLDVLCYPDERLRQVAESVEQIDSFLSEMTARMAQLMAENEGIGLAATQVGWPFRFIVVNPTLQEGKHQALINPVIVERDGRAVEEEGCLSVPGVRAKVKRADYVKVRAQTPDGEEVELEGEGLLARLLQHETDHLEGRLFVDCVGPASRIVIRRHLRELARRHSR